MTSSELREPVDHETSFLVGLALALAALGMTLQPGLENDTWWHLALGRWMVEHGTIPLYEPFTSLREGALWVRSGWLADLLFWLAHRVAGVPGLNLLTSLIVAGTTLVLWSRTSGRLVMRVVVVTVAVLAMTVAAEPRPYVLALPLLATVEYVLHRERLGSTALLWLLPLLSIVWANVHGTFILIPILTSLELLGAVISRGSLSTERARRLLVATGLVVAAPVVNPFGWELLMYPMTVARLSSLSLIEEWSPTLAVFPENVVYVTLVGLAGSVAWRSRAYLRTEEAGRLVLFSLVAGSAVRHLPLLAVVATPVVARLAEVGQGDVESGAGAQPRGRIHGIVLLTVTALTAALLGWPGVSPTRNTERLQATFPVEAMPALMATTVAGERIYHPYGWGGFVLWETQDRRSFVDSRTELFGDELVMLTASIARAGPGWEQTLSRYDTDVILARRGSALDVAAGERWDLVYGDDVAVIYRRPRGSAGMAPFPCAAPCGIL